MSKLDIARRSWGNAIPEWIEVLAIECDKTSQNKVAVKIGKSAAAVSQVLQNVYPGKIANIEESVRVILMDAQHSCPVFGYILSKECDVYRKRPFCSSGNPVKTRLFKACRRCQYNQSFKGE